MGKLTIAAATSSVVASMIGAGIFALPKGVSQAGLISGLGVSLILGWFLFTIPALCLARACDLCEELDDLEEAERRQLEDCPRGQLKALLLPPCSGGEEDGGRRRLSRKSEVDADPREREEKRPSRTYAGGVVVDGLHSKKGEKERVSLVVGSQIDANGRESVTVVEEDRKVYFTADVAERAFGGKWSRWVINGLGSMYLMFACAIFLLLMGDAVANLIQNVNLLRGQNAEYIAGGKEVVWWEAVGFTFAMMLLVQIPDVSIIAKISFVGTAAAIGICLVFLVSPFVMHTGADNFNGAPKPILATVAPREATLQPLSADQAYLDFASEDFYVWGGGKPLLYKMKGFDDAWGNFLQMLKSLSSCAFGFAFALLVPFVRADLDEPKRMGSVILIATILTAVVYAMVVFSGLLGAGQKYLLAGGSVSQSLKWYETTVNFSTMTPSEGEPQPEITPELLKTANPAGYSFDPAPPAEDDIISRHVLRNKDTNVPEVLFYLTTNSTYFYGSTGKATLMSFIMMIFLAVKLVISYPLTVWPTIMDVEGAIKPCCSRRKPKTSTRAGDEEEEKTALLMKKENKSQQNNARNSKSAESQTDEQEESDEDAEYEELPFYVRAICRVLVVALTFGIAAIFGCNINKLDKVLGLAASVPGVLSMVLFPMAAYQLLNAKVRALKARGSDKASPAMSAVEVAELVFHSFLALVGIAVLIYQLCTSPKEIAEALAGTEDNHGVDVGV